MSTSEPGIASDDAQLQSDFVPFGVVPDKSLDPKLYELASSLSRLNHDAETASIVAASLRPLILRAFASKQLTEKEVALAAGTQFTVDVTDHFAAYIAYGLLAEKGDYNTFNRLIHPRMTIVDVGANFGLYAVEAGRLTKEGKVVAIEAVPEIHVLLTQNVMVNGLEDTITTIEAAVAEVAGRQTFHVASEGSFSGLTNTSRSELSHDVEVKVISLDGLDQIAGQAVDLLKIDVEGSEWQVLRGAKEVIGRSPEIVILCEAQKKNLTPDLHKAFIGEIDALREDGFTCYAGWDSGQAGLQLNKDGLTDEFLVGNIFLVRENTMAQKRLLNAFASERAMTESNSRDANAVEQITRQLSSVLIGETRRGRHLEHLSQGERDRNEQLQGELAQATKLRRHAEIQLAHNRTWRGIARLGVDRLKYQFNRLKS